jgi:hypothetical protein
MKLLLLSTAGIFLILWLIQSAEIVLQKVFSNNLNSEYKF